MAGRLARSFVIAILGGTLGCSGSDSASGFRLADGVEVADLAGVTEGYLIEQTDRGHSRIVVNVSVERITATYLALCRLVETPGFLILELPANESVETERRKTTTDPFHADDYYLDNQGFEDLEAIYRRYEELFVHDGMLNVGCGSHQKVDEVRIGRYKVFSILSVEPAKYEVALSSLGFTRRDRLRTVWDTFTADAPGTTRPLRRAGKTARDIVEELAQRGLYHARLHAD